MFGWLKKRMRHEHIKLVFQNKMAVDHLYEFAKTVADTTGDPSMMRQLEEVSEIQEALVDLLTRQQELDSVAFDDQFKLQKQLRRMYDEKTAGQKAFALQFGSASEKIMSFDQRFEPNVGWKVFLGHFKGPN
jgi:uncharacterized membrane protein YdfJ with MMPL/SSD domain